MLLAGCMALLIRLQLTMPGNGPVTADIFNQLFTMHGSAMMFLFAVPMCEAISVPLLPGFPGARDMPLYAWYVMVVGGMILFAFPPLIAGDFLY